MNDYVHGFGSNEVTRLQDQARTLDALLHADTRYPAGSTVLEAGCGVGAQTVVLARNSPGARITAIDKAGSNIAAARRATAGLSDVSIQEADIFDLPHAWASFDHVFVCFVLEHLHDPLAALRALGRVLKPGGTLTVIEGDHGTACFHPDDADARAAIACQVALQRAAGGDAMVGRRLYPLLTRAGFQDVRVSPRLVYADASRPEWVMGLADVAASPRSWFVTPVVELMSWLAPAVALLVALLVWRPKIESNMPTVASLGACDVVEAVWGTSGSTDRNDPCIPRDPWISRISCDPWFSAALGATVASLDAAMSWEQCGAPQGSSVRAGFLRLRTSPIFPADQAWPALSGTTPDRGLAAVMPLSHNRRCVLVAFTTSNIVVRVITLNGSGK